MKMPRKYIEPIFRLERAGPPWRKAEIYSHKQPTEKFKLYKSICEWEPYDDLDYSVIASELFDTLELAIIGAKKFVEIVDND